MRCSFLNYTSPSLFKAAMYAVKLLPTCASLLACVSALPQSMPQAPRSYGPANGTNGTQYEVTEVGARNTEVCFISADTLFSV